MADELPELLVADVREWAAWLEANHARVPGVWLVLAKKGTTEPTRLDYERALEEALCFGWIDGQIGRRDGVTFRQRFTRRRPASRWSQTHVARVERLIADGRMRPAGLEAVERAKADGRWEAAYAGQASMPVPDDLTAALAADPWARANFERLSGQNRYAILYRIHDAKRPQTRARRIGQFVAMLARGETIHPQQRPPAG
jgi:uncharacterized protein YdeI (YjbR/CyaY-like superfamily)